MTSFICSLISVKVQTTENCFFFIIYICSDFEDLKRAEAYMKRALNTAEILYPTASPITSNLLMDLVGITSLRNTFGSTEEEALLKRALTIRKSVRIRLYWLFSIINIKFLGFYGEFFACGSNAGDSRQILPRTTRLLFCRVVFPTIYQNEGTPLRCHSSAAMHSLVRNGLDPAKVSNNSLFLVLVFLSGSINSKRQLS